MTAPRLASPRPGPVAVASGGAGGCEAVRGSSSWRTSEEDPRRELRSPDVGPGIDNSHSCEGIGD